MSLDHLRPDDFLPRVGRLAPAPIRLGVLVGLAATVAGVAGGWPVGGGLATACAVGLTATFAARVALDRRRERAARRVVERWVSGEWPFNLWERSEHAHDKGAVDRRYQRPRDRTALVCRWAEEWDRRWAAAARWCWLIPLPCVAALAARTLARPTDFGVVDLWPVGVTFAVAGCLAVLTRRRATAWQAVLTAWQVRADRPAPGGPVREPETKPTGISKSPAREKVARLHDTPEVVEPPAPSLPTPSPSAAIPPFPEPESRPESAITPRGAGATVVGEYTVVPADPNDDA